jgi:2-polyprenyl-3-methyl-5-hydroxy-6-metoxy-1,4-benzoquinol methylase
VSVVATNDSVALLDAIRELAEYRQEDPIATAFNVGNSFFATNEIWFERAPTTPAEIMQFYRDSVPGVAQQVFATYGIPGEIVLRQLIEHIVDPGEAVLDFGAGIGSQLIPLIQRCHCTHVDVGGVMFDYASWRYKRRGVDVEMMALADDYMEHWMGGIAGLQVGRTFDTVICTEVIEHVPDPVQLVKLLAALVRPGGRLVATTSFDDGAGMVPMHLNVGVYEDERFAAEVFLTHGLVRVAGPVYRKA